MILKKNNFQTVQDSPKSESMLFVGPFGAFPLRSVCVPFINMHKVRVHDVTHCYNLGEKMRFSILIKCLARA